MLSNINEEQQFQTNSLSEAEVFQELGERSSHLKLEIMSERSKKRL